MYFVYLCICICVDCYFNYFVGRLKVKLLFMIGMFWIGGYDESDEGGWVWLDGFLFSFFNFRKGKDRF